MTASTVFDTRFYPYYGRLHENRGYGGWCPKTVTDRTDYLQVDMGTMLSVCAVASQGKETHFQWTTSYTLYLSTDGVVWNADKETSTAKVWLATISNDYRTAKSYNSDLQNCTTGSKSVICCYSRVWLLICDQSTRTIVKLKIQNSHQKTHSVHFILREKGPNSPLITITISRSLPICWVKPNRPHLPTLCSLQVINWGVTLTEWISEVV